MLGDSRNGYLLQRKVARVLTHAAEAIKILMEAGLEASALGRTLKLVPQTERLCLYEGSEPCRP